MLKTTLAAAAVLAVLQSPAFADSYSQTTTTTQTPAEQAPTPYDAQTERTDSQRTVYPNGTQVDKSSTYHSGNGELSGTSTETVTPPAPPPSTTTPYRSTTTTVTPAPTVTTTTTHADDE